MTDAADATREAGLGGGASVQAEEGETTTTSNAAATTNAPGGKKVITPRSRKAPNFFSSGSGSARGGAMGGADDNNSNNNNNNNASGGGSGGPGLTRRKTLGGIATNLRRIDIGSMLNSGMHNTRHLLEHAGKKISVVAENVRNGATGASSSARRLRRTHSGSALTLSNDILPAMRSLWSSKPIHEMPVAKDLPRLAKRITVLGEGDEVLWEGTPGAATRPPSGTFAPINVAGTSSSTLSGSSPTPAGAGGSKSSSASTLSVDAEVQTSASDASLGVERRSAASKKPNANDTVIPLVNSVQQSVTLSGDLILALVRHLEPSVFAERGETLRVEFAAIAAKATSEAMEAEPLVRELFESLATREEGSLTLRVLKTINQDVIGNCAFELKQHLTSKFMTKDVRTAEGWRIRIKVMPVTREVLVSHVRREQSVDGPGQERNHWEFEWSIQMTFDPHVSEMTAADLRVTDLFLSSSLDPELEDTIKRELMGATTIATTTTTGPPTSVGDMSASPRD